MMLQEQLLESRVHSSLSKLPDGPQKPKFDIRARKSITRALEEAVNRFIQNIQPELIVEVGAHSAEFSCSVKALLPSADCIAIEANPHVFDRNKEAVARMGVDYRNACISDKYEPVEFIVPIYRDKTLDNMGGMLQYEENLTVAESSRDVIMMTADTLDNFLLSSKNKKNFVWIDVEGNAGKVLAGARQTLKTCVALYIEVESIKKWVNQSSLDVDIRAMLAKIGFIPVLRDVQRQGWQYNVLFVRAEFMRAKFTLEIIKDYFDKVAPIASGRVMNDGS